MKRALTALVGLLLVAGVAYAVDFPTSIFDDAAFEADVATEGRVRQRHTFELADEIEAIETELGTNMSNVLQPGDAPALADIDAKGEIIIGIGNDAVGIFGPCGDGLVPKADAAQTTGWLCAPLTSSGMKLDLTDDDINDSESVVEFATTGDTNNVVTEPTNDKILMDFGLNWPTSDTTVGLEAGAIDAATDFNAALCASDEIIKKTGGTWACAVDAGGGSVVLDLADDASNESTGITEIATTGDTNSIFTEPAADKLLIDMSVNWPTADAATALSADPADCAANQYANAIAASGALTCAAIADADVPNTITIDLAASATALAADPADCAANQFATTIAASGALTCASLVDADVPDTITASSYLPLAGGTMTGQLVADNLGVELEDSDTNPACAAGNYTIYADLSETTLKKCINGTVSDLDTTAAGSGDAVEVEDGDDAGTFSTADTTARFEDQGDINFALTDGGGGGPDAITATIRADKILESHLKAVDTAADEECLTYETTTGDFEWQACGGGGGSISFDATNDAANESTGITHLECQGNGLACSEPTADEAQIKLDATGLDTKVVTGTAGTTGHCAQWNVDGDLVTTGAACGGSGTLIDTRWDPLAPPATAETENDEFNDGSGGLPTGWTEYDPGTDISVVEHATTDEMPGFVEIVVDDSASSVMAGIYKSWTDEDQSMTTLIRSDHWNNADGVIAGIGVLEGTLSTDNSLLCRWGDYLDRIDLVDLDDNTGGTGTTVGTYIYDDVDTSYVWLRMSYVSSTGVFTCQFSFDGFSWKALTTRNPSWTPTLMGLIRWTDKEARKGYFDFFRYETVTSTVNRAARGQEVGMYE